MLLMSIVALAALVIIILLSVFFVNRASARRAQAREDVDGEIALIQKRALEVDQKLVQAVLSGTVVDTAVAEFFRERSRLLSAGRTEEPWKWSADDLEAYRESSVRRCHDAIGRRLLFPAIASILLVILATAGILAALYPAPADQRDDATRDWSGSTVPQSSPSHP